MDCRGYAQSDPHLRRHAVHEQIVESVVNRERDDHAEIRGVPHEAIDARELSIGGLGGVAIIADQGPDDRPVLLLDMGAVIFLVGPTAGKGDRMALAVVIEPLVDELGAVVA